MLRRTRSALTGLYCRRGAASEELLTPHAPRPSVATSLQAAQSRLRADLNYWMRLQIFLEVFSYVHPKIFGELWLFISRNSWRVKGHRRARSRPLGTLHRHAKTCLSSLLAIFQDICGELLLSQSLTQLPPCWIFKAPPLCRFSCIHRKADDFSYGETR